MNQGNVCLIIIQKQYLNCPWIKCVDAVCFRLLQQKDFQSERWKELEWRVREKLPNRSKSFLTVLNEQLFIVKVQKERNVDEIYFKREWTKSFKKRSFSFLFRRRSNFEKTTSFFLFAKFKMVEIWIMSLPIPSWCWR